jgi:hypothetical protein
MKDVRRGALKYANDLDNEVKTTAELWYDKTALESKIFVPG